MISPISPNQKYSNVAFRYLFDDNCCNVCHFKAKKCSKITENVKKNITKNQNLRNEIKIKMSFGINDFTNFSKTRNIAKKIEFRY